MSVNSVLGTTFGKRKKRKGKNNIRTTPRFLFVFLDDDMGVGSTVDLISLDANPTIDREEKNRWGGKGRVSKNIKQRFRASETVMRKI